MPVADEPSIDWSAAYPELKKIARARLHAAGGAGPGGLNTTALVNESYLRLAGRVDQLDFRSRGHFYAYAARTMRSVIVDLVREHLAERRGGGAPHVTLDTALDQLALADAEPLQVDEALRCLATVEPRLAQVVEMRYFAGMTDPEIAEVLGLTDRTVRRDWDKARALLRTMLA
jgi:RNA polymerase sigma factor (TIGR02999 family)